APAVTWTSCDHERSHLCATSALSHAPPLSAPRSGVRFVGRGATDCHEDIGSRPSREPLPSPPATLFRSGAAPHRGTCSIGHEAFASASETTPPPSRLSRQPAGHGATVDD